MPTENAVRTETDLESFSGSLARLIEFAPHKPYCSNNKTASLILPFSLAKNHEYIQINQPTQTYWLVFDIDHPNPYAWEDAGLPPPNIITISPDSAKSHMCYAIEPVCISNNGSQKAIAYMKAVRTAYAKALNADMDYSSPVTKNPLHPRWRVWCPTEHVYSLGELADYRSIDLSVGSMDFYGKGSPYVKDLEDPEGRNCTLFLQLRLWAYSEIEDARTNASYETWANRVLDKAERLNGAIGKQFDKGPLRFSEVKATAKSVSRWTWSKYTGRSIDRGVMEMSDAQIPLVNKQRLSARRTHQVRREKTIGEILASTKLLLTAKVDVTRSAVAKAAGFSRQTVARYWGEIEALLANWQEKSEQSKPIPAIDEELSQAISRDCNVVSLGYLARTTGIDRRKIKAAYPALFDDP